MRHRRLLLTLALPLVLAACSQDTAQQQPAQQRAAMTLRAAEPRPTPSLEAPSLAVVDLPAEGLLLPWGSREGEVGLVQAGEERPFAGPVAGAIDPRGELWVLDPANERIAHLDPKGRWLGSLPMPAAAIDVTVDEAGQLYVLSLANRRVSRVSRAGEGLEEIALPRGLRTVDRVVPRAGHLLLSNAYQEHYDLGVAERRIGWPNVLHTKAEGVPTNSRGPGLQVMLRDGAAVLRRPAAQPAKPVDRRLEGSEGALSVALLDASEDGEVLALLEWREEGGILRQLRTYGEDGSLLKDVKLDKPALYFPHRELSPAPGGRVLQLLPEEGGLRLLVHRWTTRRAQ